VPRFKLTIAYDGSGYCGWQRQINGLAVQQTLEEALAALNGGDPVAAAGAGRTDAGVHALGQTASCDLPRTWDPGVLQNALNGLLPVDVRVMRVEVVNGAFHARSSAVSKLYRYTADLAVVQLPTRRLYAAHIRSTLDPVSMRQLAAAYVGEHDFAALASAGGSVKTTVRHITRSELRFTHDTLIYEVEASGFLRKMVRSLVGGLIAIGRGTANLVELREALAGGDRQRWPAPAPAHGLTLVSVSYPQKESERR
jgi:tRNA pseudouridine38-40 synthase